MTIKQQGGIFGRNPTFNNVTVDGVLAVDGSVSVPPDSISGDAINGGTATPANVTASGTVTTANLAVAKGSEGNYANFSGDSASGGRGLSLTSSTNYGSNGAKHTFNAKSGSGAIAFATGSKNRQLIDYNGDIVFYKDDGVTTGATWDASAGNLAFASGAGIDFSATSGTGTSELFDDYEEGTWTPTVIGPDGGSAGSLAYTSSGTYTKIGRLVTVYATINITAASSYTGRFFVSGVPFSSAAGASYVGGNVWFQSVALANGFTCAPTIGAASANYIQFNYSTDNSLSGSLQWATNVTTGLIIFSHTYPV